MLMLLSKKCYSSDEFRSKKPQKRILYDVMNNTILCYDSVVDFISEKWNEDSNFVWFRQFFINILKKQKTKSEWYLNWKIEVVKIIQTIKTIKSTNK